MTPNLGQGANMAIEDAAALATRITNLRGYKSNLILPNPSDIERVLQQYRHARYSRVCSLYVTSKFLVRLQARDGLFHTLIGRYCIPYAGDLPADIASKTISGGAVCEFTSLPLSKDNWRQYHGGRGNALAWLGLFLIFLVFLHLLL
jgi:FAD dependent monooxygenase